MQKLGLNEIRERYLKFFEKKDHLRLPSFSLVPRNDPSILLINAGMTPLKPYFTGQEVPPGKRVTTCQKCIRTPDIENVGKTARHGTFFEMLGNFSFGDYFKKQAIAWAWEFVTKDMGMPEDRLYASIYEEDDEAFGIWNGEIGLPAERIVRLGKKDNFWEHGTGPCGPCSEIYFDRGEDKGCGKPDCAVGCDCDRFIEFWNLVFTQYYRQEDGSYSLLESRNIDTGMGLERLACIMQEVNSLFEVDTIRSILNCVCETAGAVYGSAYGADVSLRVITDHIRSTTMMVSDGIIPSNEGRGYVLRRLLRRASRHGKLLGIDRPFLYEVASVVIDESKEAYPELAQKADYIKKVIRIEEDRFEATVGQGLNILSQLVEEARAEGRKVLQGGAAFKLHDTYGFPLDLTREIAEENGMTVDEEGFKAEMAQQRKKAREALKSKELSAWTQDVYSGLDRDVSTEFVGYDTGEARARIVYIIKDGQPVDNIQEGDEATIILDRTPFYAESGGQVGDTGLIEGADGALEVADCKKTADGKYLHTGTVKKGLLEKGEEVKAGINVKRRLAIARNHTTTHLLHRALKNVLGDHVNQAGSLVEPDRFRFDFTHFSGITPAELERIEKEVNEKILDNLKVETSEMGLDEAREQGATALFGEKYGDTVRVVRIGEYSMELCGGTHLTATSQAGLVKLVGESSIAAGVRRIEALTGESAVNYLNEKEKLLDSLAAALRATPQESVKKAEALSQELRKAEKEIEKLRAKLVSGSLDELLSKATLINGLKMVIARLDQLDMEALRNTGDTIKSRLESGVAVLGSGFGGKVSLIVAATKDAVEKGIHSGNIIRDIARAAGGGGGGRPDMAQAGGKDVSKLDEALKLAGGIIEAQLKSKKEV